MPADSLTIPYPLTTPRAETCSECWINCDECGPVVRREDCPILCLIEATLDATERDSDAESEA